MEPQEGGDAGIELFITLPIHCSDPLFLRAMCRRGKGEDFRSVKRQARADMVLVGVSTKQDQKGSGTVKRLMNHEGDLMQKVCYNVAKCKKDMKADRRLQDTSSPSSSSFSSSTSSLSSMSDLFVIEEKNMMEFIDERSKPRFRLLAELY